MFFPTITKEENRCSNLDTIKGRAVGYVNVVVYETNNGEKLFQVITNNDDISPVADVIEDTLNKY
ncbi:MAG: hypothetical protein HFJ52_07235 [Clostridia bacterium]|nr:hypothetical protein [Clostridia bacterium]